MKRIKVLRNLRATTAKEACPKLKAAQMVLDTPAPRVRRSAVLFEQGLLLTADDGKAKVFVPLDELFKLAADADERFSAVPDSLTE